MRIFPFHSTLKETDSFRVAGIPKNLLIRFEDDKIDETTELSNTLTVGSAVSTELDLTIKVLPGMLSSDRSLAYSPPSFFASVEI